ncbi:preprotein translocase subunit SecG [Nitrosovibrio sp. Nv6]|uniref:preprotein translocase subunit SecG n=1 Tax=Nitrosovibrio sp. Nv6 TaxID=1855340 RepID=UPI0008D3F585|nr:preprotein translocase subunit SecG [Nitrosovibrio sp. Nv6]SEO34304.1 preprotein translocase subunit SecG [Nitrosovibrio sp. Nv6]
METVIWILHLLSAVSVIVLVLLQHGKGADMGAAFGSGSSGSLFGASGSANFLSRTTGVLAAVFFMTSLGLTYLSGHKTEDGGVMDKEVPAQSAKPPQPAQPAESSQAAPEIPADGGASKATEIPE